MNNTQRDYFDALAIARPKLSGLELKRLATQVTVIQELGRPSLYIAHSEHSGLAQLATTKITWHVSPLYRDISYRVERLEIMTTILAYSMAKIYDYSIPERDRECLRLGSWTSLLAVLRERWRLLCAAKPYSELPWALHEDRPVCKVCHGGVSSGHSKSNVHDQCWDYIQTVMLPALALQRQREALRHSAEVDK